MKKIPFSLLAIAISHYSTAGTCTDESIPPNRYYADSVSRLQVETNELAEFRVIKDGEEKSWLTFYINNEAGQSAFSLLLAAGASKKKVSFWTENGRCVGNKLIADRIQIEF